MKSARVALQLSMVCGFLVGLAACLPAAGDVPEDLQAGQLRRVESCSEVGAFLRQRARDEARQRLSHLEAGAPWATPGLRIDGPADANPLNNRELGSAAGDIAQVDGDLIYVLHNDDLVIARESGMVSRTDLGGPPSELHVSDGRVLVVLNATHAELAAAHQDAPQRGDDNPTTRLVILDATDPSTPSIHREIWVEGQFLGSRRARNEILLATHARTGGPPSLEEPSTDEHWLRDRDRVIADAPLSDWLPAVYDSASTAADCGPTYVNDAAHGDGILTMYRVPLTGADPLESVAVVGDGGEIYLAGDLLVVGAASVELSDERYRVAQASDRVTWLHQFRLRGAIEYQGSGRVRGWLPNAYAMSSHEGILRAVTITGEPGAVGSATHAWTLSLDPTPDEHLGQDGPREYLRNLGSVEDLLPADELYAVRFHGDVAALVTHQRPDPFVTLDLSDPKNPAVAGILNVQGYSTYLHPIDGDRFFAVGLNRQIDEFGLKLSLFDVSDLANPTVLGEKDLSFSGITAEALHDHRALAYVPERDLVVLPLGSDNGGARIANFYEVSDDGIRFRGSQGHGNSEVRRAIQGDSRIWIVSNRQLGVVDLDGPYNVEVAAIQLGQGGLPE